PVGLSSEEPRLLFRSSNNSMIEIQAHGPGDEEVTDMTEQRSPRPVSRLRWLLPALLVLAWLGLAAVSGPYAGKLSEVAENDSSAFLPSSAESTEVIELQSAFRDTEASPAIVVAERSGGLTGEDFAYLEALAEDLAALPFNAGPPPAPLPSDPQAPQAAPNILLVDAPRGTRAPGEEDPRALGERP